MMKIDQPEKKLDAVRQKDEEYARDLHPETNEGVNQGQPHYHMQMAHEIKELYDQLPDFNDEDLKHIRVVRPGYRLEQGAVYLDLMNKQEGPFKAAGGMEAREGHWYVPKSEIDYDLWNRLTGVTDPQRLRQ